MTEWISIKEGLPSKDTCVIVYSKEGDVDMADLDGAFNIFMSHTSGDYQEALHGVTHWMPLPEPPKGDI